MHRHLQLARVLATKSTHCFRHAAIVYRKKSLIGVGWNCNKYTSQVNRNFPYPTRHAEIDAMLSSERDDLSGCDVLVIRLSRTGHLLNSRPCTMCQQTMKQRGIRRCYYSISDNEIGVLSLKEVNEL